MASDEGRFKLVVPVDAASISGDSSREVQLAVKRSDGEVTTRTATLSAGAQETVTFKFDEHPGPVQVIVGPANASAEDLVNLQTISVPVRAGLWGDERELVTDPIIVSPYWWWWWHVWCRRFVIRGRVQCADGSPVPGAQVCAYDVDWWWWWISTELLGCTTTAADGTFEIDFTHCCGWWPWWWWTLRVWEFEPVLAETIMSVVEQDPRLSLGRASTQPGLGVFGQLLGKSAAGLRMLGPDNLGEMEQLRASLQAKLPVSPALAEQRIWPWWPWQPWWDCDPDVIFKVTQDCPQAGTVILDESFLSARTDFGEVLQVTLTANDQACCSQPCPVSPCVEGTCIDISDICDISVTDVGGNPLGDPAAATPAGLLDAGDPAGGDRPWGGAVDISYANVMVGVDYYEILYSVSPTGPWSPLPPGAAIDFSRQWVAPAPPPTPWPTGSVPFIFNNVIVGGVSHSLVESREHWEATVGLPAGGFWTSNTWLVVPIDSTKFADGLYPLGTYSFTVVGWQESGGVYTPVNSPWPTPLPVCDSDDPNGWTLTFNNRLDPDPTATTPCGPGTVTLCVTQPTTQIESVTVGGTTADVCGSVEACGELVIDFHVEDPTGYLNAYDIEAIWGDSSSHSLLGLSGATLSVLSGDYAGPTYVDALAAGATRPTWKGGHLRLTLDAALAFPVAPCCYDIRLTASTRTVVSCNTDNVYANESDYTLGVTPCDLLISRAAPGVPALGG